MRNTKLYSILEQFDKYEQNRCRKFLQSPYFNRSQAITNLFELYLKHLSNNQEGDLNKKEIWNQLHADSSYDDVRFRKYVSDLSQLVEDFLCQQVYENNGLEKANYLLQAITNRKIDKLYNGTIKNAKLLSQKHFHRSANFYYNQYRMETNYFHLMEYETKRAERSNFEEISNNLDYFYISEKLRILLGVLSRQTVAAHNYNISFKEELINYVKNNLADYENIPPVRLYYQVCLTYLEPDNETHYFELKGLLEKFALLFPISEALDQFYASAQNYCIRKINQGNQKFIAELFELYQNLIKKNMIIVENKLSPWDFRNIVSIGLRLNENDWVERFILEYKDKLPQEMRDNAVSFNLAQVYFYQKKYDKVIELLQKVEYEDFSYNLNSKAMLLITYYETGEVETLYSFFESFRTYLNRHKDIPLTRRQSYSELIKFSKKLTNLMPGNNKNIQKLKQELEASKNVANHAWLMEKVAELEA